MKRVIGTMLVVCLLITYNTQAQQYTPGYYVANQDTIRGMVSVKAKNTQVTFRKNSGSETLDLVPGSTNAVQFGDQTLVSRSFESGNEQVVAFAQLVLDGPISLYRVYIRQSWKYLVDTPNEPIREIKKDQLYNSLMFIARDCAEVVNQLKEERQNLSYSINGMTEWITQINDCKYPDNSQWIVLKNRKLVKKIGLEVAGYSHTETSLVGRFALGDYETETGFTGGIVFELMLIDQIGFQTGLHYISRVLKDDSVAFHPTLRGYFSRNVEITADYLAIPLHVNYYITKTALRPFVSAGGQLGISLGIETSESFVTPELPTGPGWEPYTSLNDDGWNYGFLLGAGVAYTTSKGEFVLTGQYTSARLKYTGVCCISDQDSANLKSKTARVAFSYRYIF